MSVFQYVGDDVRVWPSLGLELAPGNSVESDENPDDAHFVEVVPPAAPDA